nr:hypothetical protein [uncultured Dongia sp.]
MPSAKTISLSFRVSPRFKRLLEAAATRERRSQTNMVEALLFAYCETHGVEDLAEAQAKGTKLSKVGTTK